MKKIMLFISMGLLLNVFLFSSSALALNLRLNLQYGAKHPLSKQAFVPWAKQVKKLTDGRVRVTIFYSNALFKPKQALDAIASRVGDIGYILPTYSRDRLLLSSVVNLPMVAGKKAVINSETAWELYQTFPEIQKEWEEVKILSIYMNPAFQLHFTKKKVDSMASLKNVVISGGGQTQARILSSLGASTETMPMGQVYLAMQKGVIEGCFLPYAPLKTQKIANLLNYHTNANLMAVSFYIAINKDAWGKISAQDQKAIESISGLSLARKIGRVFDKAQERDVKWMAEKGDEFYDLTATQQAKWSKLILPIRNEWINDAKAKGYKNPEKILKKALQLMAK